MGTRGQFCRVCTTSVPTQGCVRDSWDASTRQCPNRCGAGRGRHTKLRTLPSADHSDSRPTLRRLSSVSSSRYRRRRSAPPSPSPRRAQKSPDQQGAREQQHAAGDPSHTGRVQLEADPAELVEHHRTDELTADHEGGQRRSADWCASSTTITAYTAPHRPPTQADHGAPATFVNGGTGRESRPPRRSTR